MTTATVPEILRPIKGNCEVRFDYTFKDGETAHVSGHFERFTGSEAAGITGIEVRLDKAYMLNHQPAVAKAIEADSRCVLVKFAAARITPDPETGLIIPVSRKEMATGTGAAAHIRATDRQVAYALSLCGRHCPGGGNFRQPSEAEFRAM